ncbi:hypothetical protein A2V54_03525 [candidate division WWE3 bacterium RBG_19FT_COMBO_53_11]|uniref:Cytochrome C biogenesis protein transmembrane domain-containing protein n=1 Tax=candidate division WWE3 bacterium RBG_19FT_COMBO_53_11 TaxID=1802613 RepID=A0A1F4UHY2_UNCKA|nr:MAG: hypothetical protein A2155_00065 [candidate division WWE3 bacterium RBG_16_52_45]OGC44420.1 MAG: hypothetical protein A2V54_03525 [candidate division WWE3 bacterium RBG_19FT_COMBO_53_11]
MDPASVTLGLAFLAGIVSFLSPCVLALVPVYIGYLGGRATKDHADRGRLLTFFHGLAFVVGFSLVFVALGALAGIAGEVLFGIREWISRAGGIVVVIFGLHITGIIHLPILDFDKRLRLDMSKRVGFFSSLLLGVVFSAGWTPCIGPVLGAILMLAMSGGQPSYGVVLLTAYSAGMAVPFLLTALGVGWAAGMMRRFGKLIRLTEMVAGSLLIVIGVLMTLGIMEGILSRWSGLTLPLNLGL